MSEGSEEQFGFVKLSTEPDSVLLAEGFEPVGGDLWKRDGNYFGREAALQDAHSSLLQRSASLRGTAEGKAF